MRIVKITAMVPAILAGPSGWAGSGASASPPEGAAVPKAQADNPLIARASHRRPHDA
jgi:hypothetical protein